MRKYIIAIACLFAGAANAADYPQKPNNLYAQPVGYNWSGMYLGAAIGYGFKGNVDHPFGTIETDSWLAGGFIGVNRQIGSLVYGVEVELNATGISGNSAVGGASLEHDLKAMGAAKVRLGYAFGPYLLYGHGGLAAARTEAIISAPGFSTTATANHIGYTAGAGLEMMIGNNWTGRVEYAYWDMGSANYGFPVFPPLGISIPADYTFHTVKAGLAYRW